MEHNHGIEEYLPKADHAELFKQALEEAKQERDRQILDTIKGLFAEKRRTEGEIKSLQKKLQKLDGRLKGYSLGQVQSVEEKE